MSHGVTHNGDFKLTTTGEWGLAVTGEVFGPIDFKLAVDQKFKKIDVVAKYKNKNYAFVKEVKFENTAEKLMVDTKFDITKDPFSVFYNYFCWKIGRCMTTGHRESNLEDMKFDIRRNPDYFVEFIKSGETMLKVKTDITPAMFNADIETIAYLPSHSRFHKVFNKRQGHMKISVDRVNKNALISKFKVEFDVVKDDDEVIQIQITGDTTSAPYNFEFLAPNLFKKMGSSMH